MTNSADSPTSKWDWRAYWNKARAYQITGNERGADEQAFMSTLALEFLARSALTKIHPALNAQPDDDGVSLLHACGVAVPGNPQSVQMKTVYSRLEKISPNTFTPVLSKKCRALTNLRNEELHTADLPFAALKPSDWLPGFYEAAAVLCELLGEKLEGFLGVEESGVAREMIKAAQRSQLSATRERIAAFAKVFKEKSPEERATIRAQSVRPWDVHYACPACGTAGVLEGRTIRSSNPQYRDDGYLHVEETHASDLFTCYACGLRLASLEEIVAAGIEPTFQTTSSWDPRDDDLRTDDGPDYDNM